jgi:hypothetical protein
MTVVEVQTSQPQALQGGLQRSSDGFEVALVFMQAGHELGGDGDRIPGHLPKKLTQHSLIVFIRISSTIEFSGIKVGASCPIHSS